MNRKGGGAAAQQAAEAWLEGVNVHMREWKGATSSQLETGLAGCFPYVSPERPPARRLQLGSFVCNFTNTLPVLDSCRLLGSRIWVGYGNAFSNI